MKKKDMKNIDKFQGNHPYSLEELEGYVKESLEPKLAAQITADIDRYEELGAIIEGIRYFEGRKAGSMGEFLEESMQEQSKAILDRGAGKSSTGGLFFRVAAAAVLVLLGGAYVLFNLLPNSQADALAQIDQYLEQPYALRSFPTRGNEAALAEDSWQAAYQVGAWQLTIDRIAQLDEKSLETTYYQGLSLLYVGDYKESIAALNQVIAEDNRRGYQENARWFAALGYIKVGEREQALKLLEFITSQQGHFQYEEAQKLLDLL